MTAQTPPPAIPAAATAAVLKPSVPLPATAQPVSGLDFNAHAAAPPSVAELVAGMAHMGFQASAVARAVELVGRMVAWRGGVDGDAGVDAGAGAHGDAGAEGEEDRESRPQGARTTLFLGYTSNLVSSGLREVLRFLVQHRHVSAVVTTAGGVEEDLIKCLAPTYLGSFSADGATLRAQGLNRVGNLLVPNDNYCRFEDWVVPVLDRMLEEQEAGKRAWRERNGDGKGEAEEEEDFVWTPSRVVARLGKEINDERSICYWAWKNDIPIFCPALTDGSLGDMLYFHSYKAAPRRLVIDIVRDIRRINDLALKAQHASMLILGGGVVKHHIANACLMRNGADLAVYINTAQEFDGSDAGARPDEAVSWGKIRVGAESVKVYAEATVVFPLIVAATFAKPGTIGVGVPVDEDGNVEG